MIEEFIVLSCDCIRYFKFSLYIYILNNTINIFFVYITYLCEYHIFIGNKNVIKSYNSIIFDVQ